MEILIRTVKVESQMSFRTVREMPGVTGGQVAAFLVEAAFREPGLPTETCIFIG